jgi:acyl-CoA reductase-like NAD-dependent aldehyde dehydrogenase
MTSRYSLSADNDSASSCESLVQYQIAYTHQKLHALDMRDNNLAFRMGKEIQAGRVWANCYHAYPAHAAFGGYKQSGIGRETHKMMLNHYQQTKNILMSYDPNKLGFF